MNSPSVVLIANAWGAGVDNPTSKHRIALELARRGHRVLWVEGAGMRSPSLSSGSDRGRIVRKIRAACRGARLVWGGEFLAEAQSSQRARVAGGIWVLSPLSVPMPKLELVRRLNGALYALTARWACRRLGVADPILINYVPVLAETMRWWGRGTEDGGRGTRTVYHCVDRWDAFAMYDSAMMAEMDARCCRYADLVIASSNDLFARCREKNVNTHLVMHGVDYEHFAAAVSSGEAKDGLERPADLPDGPIVGFFGLLSEWLDQDLLLALAARLGDTASLVLIGTADVGVSRLGDAKNIHIPGPRPFMELPRYIAHFRVGIIPFVVNELTRAVNPIKLREMLAAGCPVVSTALPEVARYAAGGAQQIEDGVDVVSSREDFVAAVGARVSAPWTRAQRAALSRTMQTETWEHKVAEMLSVMGV